jgi:hypothetical protein
MHRMGSWDFSATVRISVRTRTGRAICCSPVPIPLDVMSFALLNSEFRMQNSEFRAGAARCSRMPPRPGQLVTCLLKQLPELWSTMTFYDVEGGLRIRASREGAALETLLGTIEPLLPDLWGHPGVHTCTIDNFRHILGMVTNILVHHGPKCDSVGLPMAKLNLLTVPIKGVFVFRENSNRYLTLGVTRVSILQFSYYMPTLSASEHNPVLLKYTIPLSLRTANVLGEKLCWVKCKTSSVLGAEKHQYSTVSKAKVQPNITSVC